MNGTNLEVKFFCTVFKNWCNIHTKQGSVKKNKPIGFFDQNMVGEDLGHAFSCVSGPEWLVLINCSVSRS